MKYARLERLGIGRQVYYNEFTSQEAAAKYELSPLTAMQYARLFRDEHGLPRKPMAPKKPSIVLPKHKCSFFLYRIMPLLELPDFLERLKYFCCRLSDNHDPVIRLSSSSKYSEQKKNDQGFP